MARKEIQQEHYDNIICIEPSNSKTPEIGKGKLVAMNKTISFMSNIKEVHSNYSTEPILAGDNFAIALGMDITWKNDTREKFDEIGVYEVRDGKIVKEHFFWVGIKFVIFSKKKMLK